MVFLVFGAKLQLFAQGDLGLPLALQGTANMCGIVGIVGETSVNQSIYDALTVLQHRGQDAAGIVTIDDNRFRLRKANGLVKDVFQLKHMQRLQGTVGIGHVRYPTAGSSSASEAQPFAARSGIRYVYYIPNAFPCALRSLVPPDNTLVSHHRARGRLRARALVRCGIEKFLTTTLHVRMFAKRLQHSRFF